jgi:hypothetical protein
MVAGWSELPVFGRPGHPVSGELRGGVAPAGQETICGVSG